MDGKHKEYRFSDLLVRYAYAEGEGCTLLLIPEDVAAKVVARREHIDTPAVTSLPGRWLPMPARERDSLVQVCVREQGYAPSFAQGRTLRNSPATRALKWREQQVLREGKLTRVITRLEGNCGLYADHHLVYREGNHHLELHTVVENRGDQPITLDALSSFSLGGISPFDSANAPDRLALHRFRSVWSGEARPEVRSFEGLSLENSWTGSMPRSERFGVVGSAPLNGFVPLAAVEDRVAGVVWAACVEAVGSWQIEAYRRLDEASFSGGLADREFGHWWKVLAPGESFSSPKAWVTVTSEGVNAAWHRLLELYAEESGPKSETACPIIFNEWCTSWGSPTHSNLLELATRLEGSGVQHVVIDDGWAERPKDALFQSNGDWILNPDAFPGGMRATVDALRRMGFEPGIWFEFEVVNPGAKAWDETDHMLHRDGVVLEVGSRRFWDFRDPWVHEYLGQKVTDFLRENGLNYLKVDYNETIGFGVDGADSPGEGLRQHLEGVLRFFRNLRKALPDLVIENCSAGGHRHSAPFVQTCATTQFSDAHETPDIPILTANLLSVVPRNKLQVWAVLRQSDSVRRLYYSLAATFLGRMCLSGDIHTLSPGQWSILSRALALYQTLATSFNAARPARYGPVVSSYNHPAGWQAIVLPMERECLIVAHTFGNAPGQVTAALPPGGWALAETFAEETGEARFLEGEFTWLPEGDFCGGVWLLRRKLKE